jgi:hypothetical protein
MTEPSTTEEIPPLCKATFLTISRALTVLYIAAGIVLAGLSTAVTYAITNSTSLATVKEKTTDNECKLNKIDADINRKLDYLIAQLGQK